jgi:collagenase-like PrtC family protease
MCAERKLPFVAGHALNCYNAVTLRLLLKQGMALAGLTVWFAA